MMEMNADQMEKMICKICGDAMKQHERVNYIYYCINIFCKYYKLFITKKYTKNKSIF